MQEGGGGDFFQGSAKKVTRKIKQSRFGQISPPLYRYFEKKVSGQKGAQFVVLKMYYVNSLE